MKELAEVQIAGQQAAMEDTDSNLQLSDEVVMEDTNSETQLVLQQSASSTAKLTRDSGFGDMVFSRLSKWDKKFAKGINDNQRCILVDWYLEMQSKARPQVALYPFIRRGQFPFFKLPREVRDKIYGWMIADVSANHPSDIHIEIDRHQTDFHLSLETFEQYIDLLCYGNESDMKAILDKVSSEEGHDLLPQYFEEKAAFHDKISLPPFRKSNYDMRVRYSSRRDISHAIAQMANADLKKDWFMMTQIMHWSNVNTKFRAEFSKVFWSHANIHIQDFGSFLAFLKERPAVCSEIKKIDLSPHEWPWEEDERDEYDREYLVITDEERVEFVEGCEYISKHLAIDQVTLNLTCAEWDLINLEEEAGPLAYLYVLRTLNISPSKNVGFDGKQFRLMLDVPRNNLDDDDDGTNECNLAREWEKKLEKLLMPKSLLPSKPTNEKEAYLCKRLEAPKNHRNEV